MPMNTFATVALVSGEINPSKFTAHVGSALYHQIVDHYAYDQNDRSRAFRSFPEPQLLVVAPGKT